MLKPEAWGHKKAGLQFIIKVLSKYHVDAAEAAALDNLLSDATDETKQNKIKFEALTSILVTAGFSRTEMLDPKGDAEILHVVRSFFKTVLYLETALEQSRLEKFNIHEVKGAITDYFEDAVSRVASDFGWTAWKEEVSLLQARAQSLQDLFEKDVKKLVYTWASTQRDLFGLKPGEEKERAVWILGNVFKIELVSPARLKGNSLFGADNHDFALTILPNNDDLVEVFDLGFKPIKAVVDMVAAKTEELKAAAEEAAAARVQSEAAEADTAFSSSLAGIHSLLS